MRRVTELSDSEWARVDACRDAVLARSLSGVVDRSGFEAASAVCWSALGLDPPLVVWARGPLSAVLWALQSNAAQSSDHDELHDELGGQLRGQLHGQLRDQLGVQLDDRLRGQLHDELGDRLDGQLGGQLDDQLSGQLYGQLGVQLRDQLRDQLHGQLRGRLDDRLRDELRDQLRVQLRDQLDDQLRGELRGELHDQLHDEMRGIHRNCVSWGWRLAWIEHWLHVNTLPGIEPVPADTATLARHWANMLTCHYWLPYKGVVIATDHPVDLHRDNQNRLHNPNGAAWLWADGTAVWALDGIRVPPWVIYTPDPARIMSDELPNTEQRRVAMAHYGWDRAIEHLNLVAVDTHPDPHMGALYRLPASVSEEPASLLLCRNASPHMDGTYADYGLLASPDANTVEQAQASLAGMGLDEWRDLIAINT